MELAINVIQGITQFKEEVAQKQIQIAKSFISQMDPAFNANQDILEPEPLTENV
jgi:hypothetical protein